MSFSSGEYHNKIHINLISSVNRKLTDAQHGYLILLPHISSKHTTTSRGGGLQNWPRRELSWGGREGVFEEGMVSFFCRRYQVRVWYGLILCHGISGFWRFPSLLIASYSMLYRKLAIKSKFLYANFEQNLVLRLLTPEKCKENGLKLQILHVLINIKIWSFVVS